VIEVKAVAERGPRMNDPLGHSMDVSIKAMGQECVIVPEPSNERAAGGALGEVAFGIADRLFHNVLEAVAVAAGIEDGKEFLHPTVEMRKQIERLEKELADVTARMTLAEVQRDELRRIFAPPHTPTIDTTAR
jgi:hypothetical protein